MGSKSAERRVLLGIDIGGTGSRWVACDDAGVELCRGSAAGATGHLFNPVERERLSQAMGDIAGQLAAQGLAASSVNAGITGYGVGVDAELHALFTEMFRAPARVIDDLSAAYHAVFKPGEGLLVSAGTGSFGVHIARDQSQFRIGGRGILIDDAGSGSWIALRALDLMYRAHDRDGNFEAVAPLAGHLLEAMGGTDWGDVRRFVYGGDRGRIGTLAVAVARAAEDGDAAAREILRLAGIELALLGKTLASRVGLLPLAFVGGVFDLHPIIARTVAHELAACRVRFAKPDAALAFARVGSDRQEAAAEPPAV